MTKNQYLRFAIIVATLPFATFACTKSKPPAEQVKAEDGETCEHPEGLNFATAGSKWSNGNVSTSFMLDGTPSGGGPNTSLFSKLDAVAPREVWQKEYARALATWAEPTNLNFRFVSDTNIATVTSAPGQADSRFGDIRIGTRDLGTTTVGYSYYPVTQGSNGGDSFINIQKNFYVGAHIHLYTIALHELGHSLGMAHSPIYGTAMFSIISGLKTGLHQDDIDGIRSIYGTRAADSYDTAASNETYETAAAVTIGTSAPTTIAGDLTTRTDSDFYRVTVPSSTNPVLAVTLLGGESTLIPTLRIHDSVGTVIQEVTATSYGEGLLVEVGGINAEEIYHISVDGMTDDVFAVGAYRLVVEQRSAITGIQFTPPANLAHDSRETNDSLVAAAGLGTTSDVNVSGLSIHWAHDQDYFFFRTATTAKNYEVALTLGSGTAPLAIEIYNNSDVKIASSAPGATSVAFPAVKSTYYKVRVFSPSYTPRAYSMRVRKVN